MCFEKRVRIPVRIEPARVPVRGFVPPARNKCTHQWKKSTQVPSQTIVPLQWKQQKLSIISAQRKFNSHSNVCPFSLHFFFNLECCDSAWNLFIWIDFCTCFIPPVGKQLPYSGVALLQYLYNHSNVQNRSTLRFHRYHRERIDLGKKITSQIETHSAGWLHFATKASVLGSSLKRCASPATSESKRPPGWEVQRFGLRHSIHHFPHQPGSKVRAVIGRNCVLWKGCHFV